LNKGKKRKGWGGLQKSCCGSSCAPRVGCSEPSRDHDASLQSLRVPWLCQLAREPTSGLEPLTCSLRVMHQALQGFAQGCKSRISKPVSVLCLAPCCTVLRSRWCQSGVNIVLCIRVTQSSTLVPFGAHRASLTSCDRPVNLCPRLMHLAIRHRLGTDGPTSPP
jgi:hypothetical protein